MPIAITKADWVSGELTLSGAAVNIDNAASGALKIGGVDKTAMTIGVAAGYKIARGEVTLDGTNPTPIATGLATVVACSVTDKRATSPVLDPYTFTVDYGGAVAAGTVNLYAWKVTGAGDATLIASTDADDVISWIAVGT